MAAVSRAGESVSGSEEPAEEGGQQGRNGSGARAPLPQDDRVSISFYPQGPSWVPGAVLSYALGTPRRKLGLQYILLGG